MQNKFSIEISGDTCSLVFREQPSNIILFVDGAEPDISKARNRNWNMFCDFVFKNSIDININKLISTIDSYNKSRTKSEDGAEGPGSYRFMSISTRHNWWTQMSTVGILSAIDQNRNSFILRSHIEQQLKLCRINLINGVRIGI